MTRPVEESEWSCSRASLARLGVGSDVRYVRTVASSVTSAWGVNWDETLIARDLMQNFFDANPGNADRVSVEDRNGVVSITAPAEFNIERLFFLGSEKGPDQVGQYGEGFKVAATCLVRDHRVRPIAASGHQIVVLRLADRPIPDTNLYPLVYDFFASGRPCDGSMLVLEGCSQKLVRALHAGLTHFFYDGNPLLGARLWSSWDGAFALYQSTSNGGHVFYRGLKRGEIPGIPLVLVISRSIPQIEKAIAMDRDRKAFGGEVLALSYRGLARYGMRGNESGWRVVIEAARPYWREGHPLLAELAKAAPSGDTVFSPATVQQMFGDEYFARSPRGYWTSGLEREEVEREWEKLGRVALPGYFVRFGLLSAEGHLADVRRKAHQESLQKGRRVPTPAEERGLKVLRRTIMRLNPAVMTLFLNPDTTYMIVRTEALLGLFRSSRGYGSREVILAEKVFVGDFATALATFLHELAHVCGPDGGPSFTNALTTVLETAIRHRDALDAHERDWEKARREVARERSRRAAEEPDRKRLDAMGESELRELITRVPPGLLRRMLGI